MQEQDTEASTKWQAVMVMLRSGGRLECTCGALAVIVIAIQDRDGLGDVDYYCQTCYRKLKYNGEVWYSDERSLWKYLRQWLIWIGGWEKANDKGWQFFSKKVFLDPRPISLLGHLFTMYSWGWEVKLNKQCWFVWSNMNGIYVSSDATPPDRGNYGKTGFYIYKLDRVRSK